MQRVVLIGTGAIAYKHVEAVRQLQDRAQLVAAMDIDAERVAAFCVEHAIPGVYTDFQQMFTVERPQLVLIASPPAVHLVQCVAALDAGAWVWCEKPLCASLAEFDAIEVAERRTGNRVSAVFQRRFGAGAAHVHRLITSGALGQACLAIASTTWYRTPEYYTAPWRGRWANETGGVSATLGIHLIDLLLYLMGDWTQMQAMMATLGREIEVENIACATVQFASGALGSIINSAVSPREHTALRLDFERATVELDFCYHYTNADWRFSTNKAAESPTASDWANIPTDEPPTHTTQLRLLLAAMESNTVPPASGADARRSLEFVACLYKAALTGKAVRRGEVVPGDPFYIAMNGMTHPC